MAIEVGAALNGLRVLIPRPERQQDPLVDLLRNQGCHTFVLPVMEIRPIESPELTSRLQSSLGGADIVIFISSNAVNCCLDLLSQVGGSLPEQVAYFAVGGTTAERLAKHGCHVVFPEDKANSEGLLELEPLQQVAGKKILICRGEGGRDRLRDGLKERGAEVSYLELYRRLPSPQFAGALNGLIQSDGVDAIIVHSGEILAALYDCLEGDSREKIRHLRFVVPAQRIAELLADMGVTSAIVAANALPGKMVEALVGATLASMPDQSDNGPPRRP
jgi:uroporphyrinogen-III synthase